ncbi:type II toxin-antitoxin system VapC family toxin [Solwaraspora sp. WMMD406]|uniref:type II toxin-antitoxin system VapC family toxin n=1 Tax=Solwaraspora sp. WMMD406 TaxID=3016095 RepID=UPI002417A484|nr:type II toxin-antitoxin system VapC family toxin [Solwaraspora sp. WMMD406]MDG4768382.1 type II toxin-antitoxin system VapC family toxin [Solwaraspora sp. WMMD406]
MSLYYIDTSAALKLLAEESHSRAFAAFYDDSGGASWVSSTLLRIEVIRAVSRVMPVALPDARALLSAFGYVSIDDEVVNAAMDEPDRMLRSLDAIHLATARVLGTDLTGLATYDDRLAAAAKDAGITVVDPRD